LQLSLNFLPAPQAAHLLTRLSLEQHAELVEALARIITKAARRSPAEVPGAASSAIKELRHD
jgi:hypothetical protein